MSYNTNAPRYPRLSLLAKHMRDCHVEWPAEAQRELDEIDASVTGKLDAIPKAHDIDIANAIRAAKGSNPLADKTVAQLLMARVVQQMSELGGWLQASADMARIEVVKAHAAELMAAFSEVVASAAPALEKAAQLDIDLRNPDTSGKSSEWLLALVDARRAQDLIDAASRGWLAVAELAYRLTATNLHIAKYPSFDVAQQYRLGYGNSVDRTPYAMVRNGLKLDLAKDWNEFVARRDQWSEWMEQRDAENAARTTMSNSYAASRRPVMKLAPRR